MKAGACAGQSMLSMGSDRFKPGSSIVVAEPYSHAFPTTRHHLTRDQSSTISSMPPPSQQRCSALGMVLSVDQPCHSTHLQRLQQERLHGQAPHPLQRVPAPQEGLRRAAAVGQHQQQLRRLRARAALSPWVLPEGQSGQVTAMQR